MKTQLKTATKRENGKTKNKREVETQLVDSPVSSHHNALVFIIYIISET